MTEEVLGCPLNIEMVAKSVANILGIYFKCRKGEGLICPVGLPHVAVLHSGIMFDFCPSVEYFWSLFICKQS